MLASVSEKDARHGDEFKIEQLDDRRDAGEQEGTGFLASAAAAAAVAGAHVPLHES